MNSNKLELEKLISQEKTIGNFVFDQKKKCFFGDVEIVLCISEIDKNTFESESYFWGGYEVWLDDEQKEIYNGNENTAKKMAIESFNSKPELFMNFPVIYTNIFCEVTNKED